MKKKTSSIEDLKKEGVVTTADKIPKIEVIKRNMLESINEYDSDTKYMGMWLNDFLKRHKKRFEDFSIEVEEMYSESKDKGKKVAKNDKKVGLPSDKPSKSEWRKDFIHKKTGI